MELTTEYHSIWILGCAAFAGLLTLFSYFKNPAVQELEPIWLRIAAGLRFLTVFVAAILLLGIFLKTWVEEKEKPTVVLALDQSESVRASQEASQGGMRDRVNKLIAELEETYSVDVVSFGERTRMGLDSGKADAYTDYTDLLSYIDENYARTNLAASVVLSDGTFNRGTNPLMVKTAVTAPVYTLGIGDTARKSDVFIQDIQHNAIVFKGNTFPIRVDVRATGFDEIPVKIGLYANRKLLAEKEMNLAGQAYVDFLVDANSVGVQSYTVRVDPVENEQITSNNARAFFVEVLENKFRVLLVMEAPHPDVGAFRKLLTATKDYEVSVARTANVSSDIQKYDLVLAFTGEGTDLAPLRNALEDGKTAICYVVQPNINTRIWNTLGTGLAISGEASGTEDVKGYFNQEFSGFGVSTETKASLQTWPEVQVAFGKYLFPVNTQAILYQSVNGIKTNRPLVALTKTNERRVGYILGEGYWRLRMTDYLENENFERFDETFSKLIRLLLVKEDKSKLRLTYTNLIAENDPVLIHAEVYNDAYELTTRFPVNLTVADSAGLETEFEMLPSGNRFTLNLGRMNPGEYSFKAVTGENNELVKSGRFIVRKVTIELGNTRANHELLEAWSTKTGGEFLPLTKLNQLTNVLAQRDDIATVIHTKEESTSLLRHVWPLLLVVLLLTGEWFIRRWQGTY